MMDMLLDTHAHCRGSSRAPSTRSPRRTVAARLEAVRRGGFRPVLAAVAVCLAAVGLPASAAEIVVDDAMLADPAVQRGRVTTVFPPQLKRLWLEALARPDAETRRVAIDTIAIAVERGMKGWEDTVGRLREVLRSDPDPIVRRSAARALVAIDASSAADDLLAAAGRDGLLVALIVEPALARWRHPGLREAWRKRLEDPTAERASLLLAIDAVAATRDTAAVDALLAIVRGRTHDSDLRLAAARSVGQVGPHGLSAVANELVHEHATPECLGRLLAVRLLGRQADKPAVEILQRLVRDREPAVATAALERLDAIRHALALPLAKESLGSTDAGLRRAAATMVARPGDHETVALLAPLLADRNPSLRRFVTEQLVAVGRGGSLREAVAEQATKMLAGDDWRGLEQAALVVGSLDHEPAAARLVELLRHAREEVGVTAAWALRKLQVADVLEPMLARAEELQRLTMERKPAAWCDRQASQLHQAFGEARYGAAEPLLRRHVPGPTLEGPNLPEAARAAAIWALGLLHEDEPDAELAQAFADRLADDGVMPEESVLVRRMSGFGLGRMKAADHLPALRQFAGRFGVNSDLGFACFWSIERLTGEPMPAVRSGEQAAVGWFLRPLPPLDDK